MKQTSNSSRSTAAGCSLLPGRPLWQLTTLPPRVMFDPSGRAELPRSLYPWAYEMLAEKHEVMSVSRLDDLPAEAKVDRQTCIE